MKASERKWNEAETYKSVLYAELVGYMPLGGYSGVMFNVTKKTGNVTYLTTYSNKGDMNFNYNVKIEKDREYTYVYVKVGRKWIDFNDFDWEC